MPLFPPGAMTLVRTLAQSHIVSAARMLVRPSGRSLLSALGESGIGYRTQDFYSDWNYWKYGVDQGNKLKFTWINEVLNPDLYLRTGYEMKARYETLVKVTSRNLLTGQIEESIVTVAHEHLEAGVITPDLSQSLTRGQVEEAARKAADVGGVSERGAVISVTPIMGFYNPAIG